MKFTLSLLAVIGVAQADWKSGSVATYEKFTYGKFKTSMKSPNKKGTVASFYTYWDGPGFYPGGWNEIDINVVPSIEQDPLSLNAIYGDGHNKREDHAYAEKVNIGDEWHTYEMEWTPSYISYAIDGRVVRRMNSKDHEAVNFMAKAQSLRMNFWTPTFHAWGADFTPEDMPWYLVFDYVEFYSYNQNNKTFDYQWRDDFNQFDQTRWHKLSGTFESNSSIFYPQNVYTASGNLVIKMEPLDHHMPEREHHEHYRKHHGLLHSEHGTLIHDALPDGPEDEKNKDKKQQKKQPPTLGQLQPRSDIQEQREVEAKHKAQVKEEHHAAPVAHHLRPVEHHPVDMHATQAHHETSHHQPTVHHETELKHREYVAHTDHKTHRELDHRYDDQHDIEPVHFHEHAVLKLAHPPKKPHEDTKEQELNLGQTQVTQAPVVKEPTQKPVVVREVTEVHNEDKHQRHAFPIIGYGQEEVLDETAYEIAERRSHESDAHFWVTKTEPTLYDQLREHYVHEQVPEEHHGWRPEIHALPVEHRSAYHEGAVGEWGHRAQFEQLHDIHRPLDHRYDDQHDVEPVHLHEHAVHRSFEHPDLHQLQVEQYGHGHEAALHHREPIHHYEQTEYHQPIMRHEAVQHHEPVIASHLQPAVAEHLQVAHHEPVVAAHHEPVITHHEPVAVHHEPVHEPVVAVVPQHRETVHAHHQSVKHAMPVRDADVEFQPYHRPLVTEDHHATDLHDIESEYDHHADIEAHIEHQTHPDLDHRYDDQHDVEPVHFHEHAVHRAFDHPDSRSYHGDVAIHQPVVHEPIHYEAPHHEVAHHEIVHHEVPLIHDFLIQEPEHEVHHDTFHGREAGYTYYEQPLHEEHVGFHATEPLHETRHGETYGTHVFADRFEHERQMAHPGRQVHRDVVIEPIVGSEMDEYLAAHYQPSHTTMSMDYDVDASGHVHLADGAHHYQQPLIHHLLQ